MRTTEFARQLADDLGHPELADHITARLLVFLDTHFEGGGVAYMDGDRGAARRYAETHNYFWLPCRLCGAWHGGHELLGKCGSGLVTEKGRGIMVCPAPECIREAGQLNTRFVGGYVAAAQRPAPDTPMRPAAGRPH